jgi:hypothetical protein
MSLEATADVLPLEKGYEYDKLDSGLAQKIRYATARMRERMKRSLENILALGQDLLEVEKSLPYGEFGRWLDAEFAWTRRTAEHLKSVACWLSASCEIISQLRILPTAAYLLAASSTPAIARQEALQRAGAGERITPQVARAIIAWARGEGRCEDGSVPGYRLRPRLARILERYRHRWEHRSIAEMAEQLRQFAAVLDNIRPEKQKEQQELA